MSYRLPQNMVFIHSSRRLHVAAAARMANVLAPPLRVWPLHLRAFPNSSVLLPLRFAIHHFRIFHHFRNHVHIFPSFISGNFRHSYFIISGSLAGRDAFDPGLFSLVTETQRYVLLGISS